MCRSSFGRVGDCTLFYFARNPCWFSALRNTYSLRVRARKVFAILGCCPFEEYDTPTEFSPIDQTAKAVVLLASTPKECTVFQPFNNHTDLLGDILLGLEKVGNPIRFVEPEEFQQAISEQSPTLFKSNYAIPCDRGITAKYPAHYTTGLDKRSGAVASS